MAKLNKDIKTILIYLTISSLLFLTGSFGGLIMLADAFIYKHEGWSCTIIKGEYCIQWSKADD